MRRAVVGGVLGVFGLSILAVGAALLQSVGNFRTDLSRLAGGMAGGAITIGGADVAVELARTPAEVTRGLSGKYSLADSHGMLFLFPDLRLRTFWMRGVTFPIDIIWISGDEVLGVTPDVLPEPGVSEDALRRYESPGPVDAVLETRAGWASAREIRAGDRVRRTR